MCRKQTNGINDNTQESDDMTNMTLRQWLTYIGPDTIVSDGEGLSRSVRNLIRDIDITEDWPDMPIIDAEYETENTTAKYVSGWGGEEEDTSISLYLLETVPVFPICRTVITVKLGEYLSALPSHAVVKDSLNQVMIAEEWLKKLKGYHRTLSDGKSKSSREITEEMYEISGAGARKIGVRVTTDSDGHVHVVADMSTEYKWFYLA